MVLVGTANQRRLDRMARLISFAAACGAAVLLIGSGFGYHTTPDSEAYRLASMRLLDGQPLYPPMDPDAIEVYRYAPWFAVAYIPFVYAPWAWVALSIAAWAYVTYEAFRWHPVLGVLAFAGLGSIPGGNAAGIMLALLVATRLHPLAVAAFASLKVYPILFVAGYVAERRWRDAALCLGFATLLWLPALFMDLSGYVTTAGSGGISVYAISPALWYVQDAILLGAVGYLSWKGSCWTWLACAAAVPLVPPRIFPVSIAWFVAVLRRSPSRRTLDHAARPRRYSGLSSKWQLRSPAWRRSD